MPLCELTRNPAEDRRSNQVFMATGLATDEAVQEAILETSEEGRGQATAGKKGVRSGFS